MAHEKALEQLQQVQKDLTEEARLYRETARESSNNHRRQLEDQTRQLQQQLDEKNRLRADELQRQDKDLEAERAKIKEEREKADADTQRMTQEHQRRVAATNQKHEKHVERRYQEDDKAAQEATQGREELRNDAKERIDRASADHLRNVETQKDGLTHLREQQKEELHRRIEDMNQTKNRQIEEQTKSKQEIEAVTGSSRGTAIETLQLKIDGGMDLISVANKATKTNSHIMAYDDTLSRCITSGQTCIKESSRVKLQLSNLISKLEELSEACNSPTAIDSKDGTNDQLRDEIERARNFIKNCCEKTLFSLDELQTIRSNSVSSLSTNASLSAELRKTYKNYINQVGNAARKLHDAIYTIKSNMDSRSALANNKLETLKKELDNMINEFNEKLDDSPDAKNIDGLREKLKVLQQGVKDSKERIANINKTTNALKLPGTSSQDDAIQDGN